jgi:hypothetical protein
MSKIFFKKESSPVKGGKPGEPYKKERRNEMDSCFLPTISI